MWVRCGLVSCCSQCGSVHPEDLYQALREGNVRLRGTKWEGWPHLFYVYPVGVAGFDGKWYSRHLLDLDEEQFNRLAPLLRQFAGIEFVRQDGQLMYRAPYRGYQR